MEPEKNTAPHGHESPGIYLPIPVLNFEGSVGGYNVDREPWWDGKEWVDLN